MSYATEIENLHIVTIEKFHFYTKTFFNFFRLSLWIFPIFPLHEETYIIVFNIFL